MSHGPRRIDRSSSKPLKTWILNGWHPCPRFQELPPRCPINPKCRRFIFKTRTKWDKDENNPRRLRPVIDDRKIIVPPSPSRILMDRIFNTLPSNPPPNLGWGCRDNINPYNSLRDNLSSCPRNNDMFGTPGGLPVLYETVREIIRKAEELTRPGPGSLVKVRA